MGKQSLLTKLPFRLPCAAMNLSDYMAENNLTAAELGRRLQVSRSLMLRYAKGERAIPPKRAIEIERVTNGAVTRAELRPDIFDLSAAS